MWKTLGMVEIVQNENTDGDATLKSPNTREDVVS